MGLLSGLKKLGLENMEEAKVFEDKKKEKKQEVPKQEQTPEEFEKESIVEKSMVCPVCDLRFKFIAVRPGRAKLAGTDSDLRPRYEKFDPMKYDAIACINCGYAGLSRYFPHVSDRQMREIKEQISQTFRGYDYHEGIYTYDDAILRYKLALVTAMVKQSKYSERAYTALKLAWMLRGKREELSKVEGTTRDEMMELYKDEMEALGLAYEGFTTALSKESAPIANMDENTLIYLLAELARRLRKFNDASRLCGMVLTNKSCPPRLKDKALDLKEAILSDKKKYSEAQGDA